MNVAEWPVQAMLDKDGRNHAWQVLKSKLDSKDKSFYIEIVLGSDKSEIKHATYEDICKEFSWKSFEVTTDGQTIIPVPDTESFYSTPTMIKRADNVEDGNVLPKRKRRARKTEAVKE